MHFRFAAPDAARTISDNLWVGAPSTDFRAVKEALEGAYAAVGVSCADVGGLWDDASGGYYADAEPCVDWEQPGAPPEQDDNVSRTNRFCGIESNKNFLLDLMYHCNPTKHFLFHGFVPWFHVYQPDTSSPTSAAPSTGKPSLPTDPIPEKVCMDVSP